ncbi:Histidinol-phosphate aminotransferase [Azospirillaceae bacterium]
MIGPIPRPGILDISPYVGGESQATGQPRLIRLASNEGAYGPSPQSIKAYHALAHEIHRYPDGGSNRLCDALSVFYGIDRQAIVCGSGSDEILGLIARAYAGPGDEVLYTAHGFLMYPIAAKAVGATPVAVAEMGLTADVDALLAAVTPRTRILFLANPNNPTGSYLPRSALQRLHAGLPRHVLLVIDAAYAEFVTAEDYTSGIDLVLSAQNVVMTRTFSKIYALASLRLGWCFGPQEIIDVLHRIRGPFNVSSPAQAAGIAALEDVDFVERVKKNNQEIREWFAQCLTALGLVSYPSVGNFSLVDFRSWGDAENVRLFLKGRGILVRQMGVYNLSHCLRITIGQKEEMDDVIQVLQEYPR